MSLTGVIIIFRNKIDGIICPEYKGTMYGGGGEGGLGLGK